MEGHGQRVPDHPERGGCHGYAAGRLPPGGERAARAPGSGDRVLLLSHFCPSPFLCFGDVCVGATRTRSLILQNPNEELSLQRAADQSFSVVPSCCELKVGVRACPRGVAPLEYSEKLEEKLSQLPPSLDGGDFCRYGAGNPTLGQLPVLVLGLFHLQGRAGIEQDPNTKSSRLLTVDGLWHCIICVNTWQKWVVICSG